MFHRDEPWDASTSNISWNMLEPCFYFGQLGVQEAWRSSCGPSVATRSLCISEGVVPTRPYTLTKIQSNIFDTEHKFEEATRNILQFANTMFDNAECKADKTLRLRCLEDIIQSWYCRLGWIPGTVSRTTDKVRELPC